ncbi:endonuclease/exonuclease/phosphatase family protein [Caldanaerobius polysaccharolyticus]|uniref:endonuclease/exonuclease/phosphatase family protein n=1 Tax=Caldanaerobius polysaccharolyticus TaxID=44256 RepID=UPI0004787B1F|nr:endonuclease/exonuclease/phosphatase family protein [Caldanaerobius polysaccharolyticus]
MKLNVMTYNIHGGRDRSGRINLDDVADVIRQSGAQVIGLQEVDSLTVRSHMIDEIRYLSKKLGMYYAYGPNIRLGIGFFGNGILSAFPIEMSKNYHLPSQGERRGLLLSRIVFYSNSLWFLTTHLGLKANERIRQAEEILKVVEGLSGPVILTGDFNETPGCGAHSCLKQLLLDASEVVSSDYYSFAMHESHGVKIDYIMHTEEVVPQYVGVIEADCSDHLPVISSVMIS